MASVNPPCGLTGACSCRGRARFGGIPSIGARATFIGGGFLHYDGVARDRIARANVDGSLDASFVPALPNSGTSPSW